MCYATLGVANQVIERAIRRIKNDTSPNNAYKILIPLCPQENSYAELPSRQNLKLKLSPSICRRDYLTWVGASVFASLKVALVIFLFFKKVLMLQFVYYRTVVRDIFKGMIS
jgi:hypothetical protein